MKNIDKLKQMNSDELAQKLVFDDEGFERSPCPVCANHGECDDKCYHGVKKWLESEAQE